MQKTKKSNARPKKGQKANSDVKVKDEEESNTGVDRQSSSSYNSSEDDNASQETNGAGETSDPKSASALNLNGKTRANRGSATDPQSLYARVRYYYISSQLRCKTQTHTYISYMYMVSHNSCFDSNLAETKGENQRAIENLAESCA